MRISYEFDWQEHGTVSLTDDGRPLLPKLSKEPGIYRITFHRSSKSSLYIGETDNFSRRAYHYRNPGPSQKTSRRINGLLRRELAAGTRVEVATIRDPVTEIDGRRVEPDFSRRPYRLLFENAALVGVAQEGAETHNL